MVQKSVRHCFARLTSFSGRDTPRLFWPYAGLVLGAGMMVWVIGFAFSFVGIFGKIQKFAVEHPDQVTVTQGPGQYSIQVHGNHPELMPDFGMFFVSGAAICAAIAALVGAAVVRRLHDSDWRGWIALVPLTLLFSGFTIMHRAFGLIRTNEDAAISLVLLLFANNLAYLIGLGGLAYFLIRKGTPGPNRFGEARQ